MGLAQEAGMPRVSSLFLSFIYLSSFADGILPEDIPGLCKAGPRQYLLDKHCTSNCETLVGESPFNFKI